MPEPRYAVVCAYRETNVERAVNWQHNRDRWGTLDLPIITGDTGTDPFSRAGSRNAAVAVARPFDAVLIVDADIELADPARQGLEALDAAAETGRLIYAHDHLVMLEREQTEMVLRGAVPAAAASGLVRHPNCWSQALAVPSGLWDAAGGYDERFVDWGGEDLALMAACRTLSPDGGFGRVKGDAYHLWHPRDRADNEGNPHFPANQVLYERYLAALGNRRAMDAILREPGGPLA